MAVTKIKPIRGTVNKAIAYILDPQKTDDAFYVSSYGCAASDAAAKEFEWTRNLAVQQGMQMPKVLARHLIQSFDIGEVTPEEAHEVGKQLADEWLKGKYEYENVKNSTVKPTERFREEGVGREPFSKGVSSDRLKCSSCRNGFGKISPALFHGRKSSVGRVDPSQVVVLDVSVNHALYLIRRHFCRIHLVQLLLLQCSEKALHSRVVVTSARAAYALYRSVFFQAFAEHRACVLASPVAVQDHAARSRLFTCVLKCGAA